VTSYSPSDIPGRRRPKVKFGIKAAYSTRMMCALRVLEKVFLIAAKFAKKSRKKTENAKKSIPFSTRYRRNHRYRKAKIGINI